MSNPSDWMQINYDDVTRAEISPATIIAAAPPTGNSRNSNLSIDQGRVARPIRRRSRASRRTPTTLLNTDTTNFRAMVQQFTGSPTTTSSARSQLSNVVDFTRYTASTAVSSMSPASGFPGQYPNHMQQRQMFVADNMHDGGEGGGVSSRRPPESSPMNENHNYDNYMF